LPQNAPRRPHRGPDRAAGDRRQDVDLISRGDFSVERRPFAVHEEIDVPAHRTLLVQDPPGQPRIIRFQFADHVPERGTFDGELALPSSKLAKRRPQANDRHGSRVYRLRGWARPTSARCARLSRAGMTEARLLARR
jgi:hypothetical protein